MKKFLQLFSILLVFFAIVLLVDKGCLRKTTRVSKSLVSQEKYKIIDIDISQVFDCAKIIAVNKNSTRLFYFGAAANGSCNYKVGYFIIVNKFHIVDKWSYKIFPTTYNDYTQEEILGVTN